MKFRCNREILSHALQLVSGAVPQKTTRPVLQNCLIKVQNRQAEVYGTDLEVGLKCVVELISAEEPGEILVPCLKAASVVREMSDEEIALSSSENRCMIVGRNSRFSLLTAEAQDFPQPEKEPSGTEFTVSEEFLKSGVARTAFAAAKEKMHYALNGALLNVSGKTVDIVATDGRRMALVQRKGGEAKKDAQGIIPGKALMLLEKMLLGGKRDVSVTIAESAASFRVGDMLLSSRLVEGHFPNYQSILPKEATRKAVFKRDDVLAAVRAASLVTTQDSRSVKFIFEKSGLSVTSSSPETGEAAVQLEVEYEGEDAQLAFNPDFVMDFLRAAQEDKITLQISDPAKATLFSVGSDYRYVLMPITGPDA